MSENKKNKNKRRVLAVSCIFAALIVASSTFAWFTSKDEVTNRLSANADYGVAVAEDFTPPENLLPGQVVNKDVGVVNTGNVDALVKVHLTGAMNILKENAVASEVNVLYGSFHAPTTSVKDSNLTKLGLTLTDGNGNYFRTLSNIERDNPESAGSTNNETTSDSNAAESSEVNHYSEVESVQAGGYLAFAGGSFTFTPENSGYTYRNDTDTETITQTTPTALASSAIKDTWTNGVGLQVDTDTFKPTSSGLFIFRRDVTESNAEGSEGTYYEYSGYYYVAKSESDKGGEGTYYALHYLPNEDGKYKSDYVIYSTKENAEVNGNSLTVTYETTDDKKTPVVSVVGSSVKLFSASYTRVTDITGTYDAGEKSGDDVTKAPTVTFTYDGDTSGEGATTDDDIKVTVYLDNVGVKAADNNAETWTEHDVSDVPYFYYNNDVEEGDTTSKLVDSVELDKGTKKSAYLAFDFDLSVLLDSVQVTVDESGKEQITAATETWTEVSSAIATVDSDSNEISFITWKNNN